MKEIRFFKQDDKWYADVPNHTLEENEMVFGCDTFLNMIGQGRESVTMSISDKWEGTFMLKLTMKEHDDDGAFYTVESIIPIGINEIWICNVTHDVFGEHPEIIYILGII